MISPTFLGAFASPEELPQNYERIFVCVGRSNVGKSSFVNTLTSSRISRVSNTPGRTQTLNAFALGKRTLIVDLPGYGFAKHTRNLRDTLEERIYQTLTHLHPTCIFVIIDACVGITALDREMLSFLEAEHLPFMILANKVDKLNQKERSAQERLIRANIPPETKIIFCSTISQEGFGAIHTFLN